MLLARQAKLAYQIAFSLISSMVSFLPSAGAAPTIDENFSHVGVTPETDITTSGNVTDIVGQKQNNVIGWRDFSVGGGETVRFDNGANSKNYLNMVTGASTSAIYGTIQGGKDVYVVNPHGVIFGKDASVNVGNLYVSTQNINPATVINAVNTANASGTDVAITDVLGSDYTNPTKKIVSTETVTADGSTHTNTSVSHLADVVSLIDDGGSVVANKVVLVGGHVRFLNSEKISAKTAATPTVEAYYDQQDTAIDGYVHVGNSTGATANWTTNTGKTVDYYQLVGTADQLQAMNNDKTKNYMLKSDIDMSTLAAAWTPVGTGTGANAFTGKFDGMMHEIQNLTITNTSGTNQGLFGVTNGARIDNVGVVNPTYNVSSGGALVGNAVNTTLRTVYVEGGNLTLANVGSGGLVGSLDGSKLNTAYVASTTINAGSNRVAGLVGSIQNSSSIENAYFDGTLSGTAYAIYGRFNGTNPLGHIYFTNKDYTIGPGTPMPRPTTVIGGSDITNTLTTYTTGDQDWDISNTGGTNSIWRIYEGQTNPLLTAFMKGTIQADVSIKEYERAKDSDGNYIGAHASADTTFSAYTQEVASKGTKALNGADLNQVYDANVIKYVKNDGTAITSASDVDFLHKLTSDYGSDSTAIKLGDSGNDNKGVRNVAAMKSYIYSTQRGYDIVGGNVTITPRSVSSASDPIKVADKVYDGIDTISKADLQAALDSSVTSYTGILADDQDIGMKLAATDTLATYTNTGYNADKTTKYTTTAAKDAGYNKIINTTGAIQVQGATSSTANNYSLNAADIIVTGTIKQREIYVDLNKGTGIDKVYDATSAVRELTNSVAGGTSYIGGTEGVAPDENIKVDDTDEAHKILNNEASIDYASSTARYYDGTSATANEVVNATDGSDDYTVKYDNITLTGTGKDNYKLVQKSNTSNVIYASAMQGAAASEPDAVAQNGTLNGTGTVNRRELDKATFEVLSGGGTTFEATKVYDGTSVYDSGSGAFKMMTNVIVDDTVASPGKETNLAAEKTGILKSEIDKIAFTVTTGKGEFRQGDRTTAAVDAAGANRAQYVAYNLTATNEDATKNWLGNYKLVDNTTTPATETNLANGTTSDIIARGTITKRALYVDLGKKTGIDKVYDATTGVNSPFNTWNDVNTTNAANGGAVYAGDSLTNAGNRLVSDGTSIKVTAAYDNKDVIRGINGDNVYTDKTGYETIKDNTHAVNYTVAVDGAKSYNYVLVDQNNIPSDLSDKLASSATATNASVALAGTGKIDPAALTVSFGRVTKEYDRTTDLKKADRDALTPTITGLKGSDAIAVGTITSGAFKGAYSDATVANNKTVTYSDIDLTDVAKNYAVTTAAGETVAYASEKTASAAFTPTKYDITGKGDITKATISYLTAETQAASKVYDGGAQVETSTGSALLSDVKGLITKVTVKNGDGTEFDASNDVVLRRASYRDKNAGTGKSVDYTFDIVNSSLYNNNPSTQTHTATNGTIEKRAVTVDQIVNSNLTRAYMGSTEKGAYNTSGTTPVALAGDNLVTFNGTSTTTINDGTNTYTAAAQGDDTGFIAGDRTTGGVAITNTTTGTYDTGNVKRDSSRNVRTGQHTVTYDLSLSDMTNYEIVDNYTTKNAITQKTGAGTITPRQVNATVGKVTKTYDAKVAAENIASAVSVATLFGDTATITGEYQADTAVLGDRAKDVGTNKDVNYTADMGTSSDGYSINDNYDIQLNGSTVSYDATGKATFTGKGDITKRDLKVQTSEDVAKTYDGTSNVTSGQGTVSAVTNADDVTGGLQLDDNGAQDVVAFTVTDANKKYTGYTKADGTVRQASDANANAADPDSTAMLWRVAYENVQAAGADLKNYNLVGKETENNLQATAANTYSITGKGRINRVALGDSALKMDIADATKVYDATADVKYTDNTSDVYKYMTNVRVDFGGGHEDTLNSADFAGVVGTYDNGKNVASNATLPTGSGTNVTYTITLGNNIGNDNYTIGTTGIVTRTGKGTITPRDVKATLQNDTFTKTYDGTTAVKVGGNTVSGDSLIALEAQSGTRGWIDGTLTRTAAYDTKNVLRDGSGNVLSAKTVTYTNTFDSADTAANYNITYVKSDGSTPVSFSTPVTSGGVTSSAYTTGTVNTINPKDVTITAPSLADLTKTWDNTTVVRPANSADGKLVVNGIETIDTSTAVLNHPSAIGADESASGKYTAAYDSVNAGSRTVKYSGVKLTGADAVNYNLASFAQTGTGGATGTLTANAAGAYDFAVNGAIASLPLDINALKITLNDITKTYDGTTTLEHKTTLGTETTDGEAWKNYISSIYLELNPSGSPSSKVYLSTSDIENVSAAYTDANAGTGKSVTYSFKLKDNGNYSVTGTGGVLNTFNGTLTANKADTGVAGTSGIKSGAIDITKRNATVTIGDAVKIYDGGTAVKGNGNVPAITDAKGLFTFQAQDNTNDTGWVTTDATPSSISGAYADKNAGTGKNADYTIAYGANDLNNYAITYVNSNGVTITPTSTAGTSVTLQTATNTIKQREVGLNTKRGITKVYDRNTNVTDANAVLELEDATGGDTGVIAADKANLLVNIGNKAYDSKNVMGTEGSTIHYTGVTLSGTEAGNYKLVNGSAAGNSNFADNGSGAYTIDGTGTITPKSLTINTGTGITKVYDGNTDVYINAGDANQLLKLAGIISGDSVSIAGYDAAYASKNVKGLEGSTINYSNIALATGGDAANYTLASSTAQGTGTITPRNLEVKIGKVTKTYDAATSVSNPDTYVTVEQAIIGADGKPTSTSGWVEAGAATVNGAFRTKDVSTDSTGNTVLSDKAVDWTMAHQSLTDGNYNVTYKDSTGATLTGTTATAATTWNNRIDQKELDVTFNRMEKTYDGTDDVIENGTWVINPTFTGLVGGETIQPTSAALGKIKGKYVSTHGEAADEVARDAAGNVLDKNITYTGISEALRALPDNPTGTAASQFKNTNYKIADRKTGQEGRINPLKIKIGDIKADYDAIVREYQKGTGGYTTEIDDAAAASSLHLKVLVPASGGTSVWKSVSKEGVKAWFGDGAQDVTNSTANGDVGTGKTVTYTIGRITNFTLDDGAGNDALAGKTEAEKFTYLNMDGANYRWQNSTGQTYATGSIMGDASTQVYDPAAATRQTNAITPRVIEVTAVGRNTKVYDGTKDVLDYTMGNLAFTSNPSTDSRGTVNGYGIFTADATGGTSFTTDGAEYADKDAGTKNVTYGLKLANGNGNYSVKYVDTTGTSKTDTSTAGTDLSLAVLGTNTGVIEKRKVKVSLGTTTGLDKTYDGADTVTAANRIVIERNASATDDASKKTGILSGESTSLDDNGTTLAANGKYRQAGTEGAAGVYRRYNNGTGYYDPSYKDATYDVSTLALTENAVAVTSHAKASNYEFVTDNTVDYDAVRTAGATKAADDAAKVLRGTGTIQPQQIKIQTKVDPTKVYDGNTDVIGTGSGINYATRYNITAGANRTDTDILSDGTASSPNTATKAGITISGTPRYNSKNVSEAHTATYTLNQTNGNYDLYDVAGNKLSKWTSATTATAKLDTAATITPKQLTWNSANVGYANKDYDGTTSVVNAVDNILAQTVGSVGTNHGNALVGVVDGDQVDIRSGLTVTGTYDNANAASGETPTGGVDRDGHAVTGADALLDHAVTYRISVDPTKMDATTAANYDFSVLTSPTGMTGKGSINRAELVLRPDSITIPMDSTVPGITGSVTGAVTGGDAVNQGDFSYALNDPSFSGTGESGVTMMGSNRVRPGYRLEGRLNKAGSAYDGETRGNYGMNYRFRNAGGSLDVRMFAPNHEDKSAKDGLVDARRFTPDDFAWYDASLTDWKDKTYYRQPDALVDRANPAVKIDGAISVEEALYATIPRGFGNYAGIAVVPVSAGVQDTKAANRKVSTPAGGVKLTLLMGGADAPVDDDDALEKEREEEQILARRRAMISIRTEGLGVAL